MQIIKVSGFCISFATTHNLSFFYKIVNWLFSLEYTNALLQILLNFLKPVLFTYGKNNFSCRPINNFHKTKQSEIKDILKNEGCMLWKNSNTLKKNSFECIYDQVQSILSCPLRVPFLSFYAVPHFSKPLHRAFSLLKEAQYKFVFISCISVLTLRSYNYFNS